MKKILVSIFAISFSVFACANSFKGKVIGVIDGDTVDVIYPLQCIENPACKPVKVRLRLAEIDTPEKGQPYGSKSRQMLSELVFKKPVTVQIESQDRYGRSIAQIWLNGDWINGMMVKEGAAWVYRQYMKHKILIQYEEEARSAKKGLWGLSEAERLPPWEWRKFTSRNNSG